MCLDFLNAGGDQIIASSVPNISQETPTLSPPVNIDNEHFEQFFSKIPPVYLQKEIIKKEYISNSKKSSQKQKWQGLRTECAG